MKSIEQKLLFQDSMSNAIYDITEIDNWRFKFAQKNGREKSSLFASTKKKTKNETVNRHGLTAIN